MGNCCNCFKNIFYTSKISSDEFTNVKFQRLITENESTAITSFNISTGCENKETKCISLQDFQEIKLLGRGSFGKVLLVKKISNQKFYAMKVLKKKLIKIKNQEDHTKTERKILEKIDHPFIVNLHYAFQDADKLYLVTEFMQGGELFYHLRNERVFKEERAKFYVCELVLALEYLHKNNCIYRDLKPENILLGADGHIKLTDFGLSKIIMSKKDEKAYTICGTPEYLAPEIITERGYDKSVDWWSLGALLYEMLSGFSPFKTNNYKNRLDIENYTKTIPMHSYFSENVKSLIQGLLTVNPKHRLGYGPNGSEKVKSHPFFNNVNWDAVIAKNIKPTYIPKIKNETNENVDLSNFDSMFTKENIFESNSTKKENLIGANNQPLKNYGIYHYEGFTYVKPGSLLQN